jgi:hypothetical protein
MQLADDTLDWVPVIEPWEDLISFDELKLPEFPTHALPGALRNWVEEEAYATQTPADLAGLLALAVCSATIARRVVVEPRNGWHEPANLFVAVLLGPGNRKSAVFSNAMKPLREIESELIEDARESVARAQSERRQDEALLRKLEKLAAEKGDSEARHDAGELAAKIEREDVPALPRLLVDDSTAEKLAIMLSEQGGRIASMSPEGGVFDLMSGMYSKNGGPQFGVYLMGHSGDDLVSDRVSRESVRVNRPALTCAYAIQPQVIQGVAKNDAFRGRGLLARYLYMAPKSWIGSREIATTPVSETVKEAYHSTIRRLFLSCQEIQDESGPVILYLSDEASRAFKRWETEIESMLGDGGQMELMRDWGAKLAGATLRIAAVVHCVQSGMTGPIEKVAIESAITIAKSLITHADAVLNMMQAKEGQESQDARYVLGWIDRHDRREFTKRDAQQHGKRRFPKAGDIDLALEELLRRGYIRKLLSDASKPGRPSSPAFEVNPKFFANTNPEKRAHNSQKSPDWPIESSFENNEDTFESSECSNREQVRI